ncbi:hypothetical protein FQA47_011632 [Oryzias melastigma]|uniref:Fibronectin type-III domain-containing protein n=1 Tax=Oryzias melastigma TaxID=30732 RepID=A0A834FCE3_ORYME|nr:hypothetical protein FQA47_011632 [Oryzias melastigma]
MQLEKAKQQASPTWYCNAEGETLGHKCQRMWSPVKKASHYSLLITKQGSSGSQKLTVYGEIINVPDLSPNSTYCFSILREE